LGANGLAPVNDFMQRVLSYHNNDVWAANDAMPSLFWFASVSDEMLIGVCWSGVLLGVLCMLGKINGLLLALMWLLQLSLSNVGQVFWGYGWESQLLETCALLAIAAPLLALQRRHTSTTPSSSPPMVIIILLQLLIGKIMLGAGLIKLRGDECWRALSCMRFHYETQPIPNPLSFYLHQLPNLFHSGEVLFNHWIELVTFFCCCCNVVFFDITHV
jgi:hypothetical protein